MTRHKNVTGACLHGLLEYVLGHGKVHVTTKQLMNLFVNRLWLVVNINEETHSKTPCTVKPAFQAGWGVTHTTPL